MNALFPELSVVVVSWNTVDMLRNCLLSLYARVKELSLEVIVVDNGSTDGSVEMCEKDFPGVRLIRNGDNLGFGRANNQGILISKAKLVLLLNSDTIVIAGTVEKMVKRMNEDPAIGVLGCRLILPDGSYQPSCLNFPSLKRVLVERFLLYKLSAKLPQTVVEPPYVDSEIECDYVVGACMLIRKRALEAVGMFDPDIFMYGEEMELCYRIHTAEWRIVFEPGAKIIHQRAGSWRKAAYSSTFLKRSAELLFFRKHFPVSTYCTVRWLYASGAMLRLVLWTFLYLCRTKERGSIVLEIRSNLKLLGTIMGDFVLHAEKHRPKKHVGIRKA